MKYVKSEKIIVKQEIKGSKEGRMKSEWEKNPRIKKK